MIPIKAEQSTQYASFTFKDKTGAAQNPASSRYRIDNVTTGAVILDWTNASPSGGVLDLTITPAQTTMAAPRLNEFELVRVSVEGTYSGTDKVREDYEFWIQRQKGL